MNAVPFFAQNMAPGAQVIQGASLLAPQIAAGQLGAAEFGSPASGAAGSIVHLTTVGYGVPSSGANIDRAAYLQSGAGLV